MIEIWERSKIFCQAQNIYKKLQILQKLNKYHYIYIYIYLKSNIILKYGIYNFFCLFAYLLNYVLL